MQLVAGIIKAMHLGVPQRRERLIVIGARADLGVTPTLPNPQGEAVTVRQALKGLSSAAEKGSLAFRLRLSGLGLRTSIVLKKILTIVEMTGSDMKDLQRTLTVASGATITLQAWGGDTSPPTAATFSTCSSSRRRE